jgi:hypothetical protein
MVSTQDNGSSIRFRPEPAEHGAFPAGSAHIPAGTCRKNIETRKQYSGRENRRARKRVFPAGS